VSKTIPQHPAHEPAPPVPARRTGVSTQPALKPAPGLAGGGGGGARTTASMQVYGVAANPDRQGTSAGLVLLFAPTFTQFLPAYLLQERDLIIGRDPTAGICVPEAAVSRQHARIHYKDGSWVLTDLGGRNGTIVDGGFVSEIVLEHLHEIRVGDAIFKFVEAGAESYARYRIDGTILGGEGGPTDTRTRRGTNTIIGGYQLDRVADAIRRVSRTELSVILLGESGTGKEVFAQQLHAWSGRRGAFQAVNCAAIPATLLESELFGYKRGAFSGADRDKIGLVRAAEGGTLFLDEIGDMPMEAQAKLLRMLQSHEIVPLGATHAERVDVRIVCATHRELMKLQQENKFRGDLFARLNEYSLVLPPLRERKEDVFSLCRALLERHGRPDLLVTFPFMTGLLHYDFPFNVRELEAFTKRAIALCDGAELDAQHLPHEIKELMKGYGVRKAGATHGPAVAPPSPTAAPAPPRAPLLPILPTEQELRALLTQHRGNVAAVGRELGRERMQVHRWMKRYGIEVEEYR
jgi:DNA-binding NtrC family response regulator